VRRDAILEERARSALGQVDVLIDHDHVPGRDRLLHRADGRKAHQVRCAGQLEGGYVRPIVDQVRWHSVLATVTGHEQQLGFAEPAPNQRRPA
jgi:hypothetical protein